MTKLYLVCANTGRTAILRDQIVERPTIHFGPDTEVLDFHVENSLPEGLALDIQTLPSKDAVSLSYPLLNPGDRVVFSILLAGKAFKCDVTGRIVNLHKVLFVDRRNEVKKAPVPFAVYLVGAVCAFLSLFSLAGIAIVLKEAKVRRKVNSQGYAFPRFKSRSEYEAFIKALVVSPSASDRAIITETLHKISHPENVGDAEHIAIEAAVRKAINNVWTSRLAFGFIALLDAVGLAYVIAHLWGALA